MIQPRLKEKYEKEVIPEMMKRFKYKNKMEVPKLEKIVINMGIGKAIQDIKSLDSAMAELSFITGQRPVITRAKKSVSGFKLRKGMPIGCKVTLRRNRMYELFDRLVNIAIPRIRDFRGMDSQSFDEKGSYNFGVKEQLIFPEIDYDKIEEVRGMNITIVTSTKSTEEAKELLKLMGMPFRKE